MKEKTRVDSLVTMIEKRPFASVTVPAPVSASKIVAPGKVSPRLSVTVPLIVLETVWGVVEDGGVLVGDEVEVGGVVDVGVVADCGGAVVSVVLLRITMFLLLISNSRLF